MLNPSTLRQEFPIFKNHPELVYLDNAATSQKPQVVIDAISDYYRENNSNVGRGVYQLAQSTTEIYHQKRERIARFFGAQPAEFIAAGNTTEAINAVAYGWARRNLDQGDVILVSLMEHHSNLVVWQQVSNWTGAKLEFINLTAEGKLSLTDFEDKLKSLPVRLVALTHVSNTLGTRLPLERLLQLTRKHRSQAKVLIDGAQAVSHLPVNFSHLGVDFYAFSSHKMLGPTSGGGLLVRRRILDEGEMEPWLFGGGMIASVTTHKTEFNPNLSERFTAGTPDIAGIVGLAKACDYLANLGLDAVREHDHDLVQYALARLGEIDAVEIVGPHQDRVGSVAFIYHKAQAHDVAQILANENVAVRSGHHCCMPLHLHYGWQGTIRASFSVYNTRSDIDQLIKALGRADYILA